MTYRTGAIFAGFASAVALIAGLAGGVPFATVLVRALIGAAVFGAFGVLAATVLQRYVPELFARPSRAPEPAPEEAPAPSIDIVLPEESPLAGGLGDDLEPPVGAAAMGSDGGSVELLETLAPETGPGGQGGSGGPGGSAPVELPASEVEAIGLETAEAAGPEPAEPGPAELASGEVEALPSLEGLDAGTGEPAPARSAGPRSGAAGGADARTDPSLAAQALRTWLKRDHEG
jgi:hypothetical protein